MTTKLRGGVLTTDCTDLGVVGKASRLTLRFETLGLSSLEPIQPCTTERAQLLGVERSFRLSRELFAFFETPFQFLCSVGPAKRDQVFFVIHDDPSNAIPQTMLAKKKIDVQMASA